jgi:hypothetical protein
MDSRPSARQWTPACLGCRISSATFTIWMKRPMRSSRQCFLPRAFVLDDPEAWYAMREQLTFRREARRKQLRFRKDPAAYLAALEDILLKIGLPSLGFFERILEIAGSFARPAQ